MFQAPERPTKGLISLDPCVSETRIRSSMSRLHRLLLSDEYSSLQKYNWGICILVKPEVPRSNIKNEKQK